jgi:hypothetical protein
MRQLLNQLQKTPAYYASVVGLSYIRPVVAAEIAAQEFFLDPASPAYTNLSSQLSPAAQQHLCNLVCR